MRLGFAGVVVLVAGFGSAQSLGVRLQSSSLTWREWSDETLAVARQKDQPLFVVLGPSRLDDGLTPEVGLMSRTDVRDAIERSFVPVAVDRDERPELRHVLGFALALIEPEAEAEGRALWLAATPDGWPFAGGVLRGDRAFSEGFGPHVDDVARRFYGKRAETNARAGLLLAQLRGGQDPRPSKDKLGREVVERALSGLRLMADPSGRPAGSPHGPLRLLLVEAPRGQRETRRMLAAVLDGWARDKAPQVTSELALRVRALSEAFTWEAKPAWRATALGLADELRARQLASGLMPLARGDPRALLGDQGLALGGLALAARRLGRAEDLQAARALGEAALTRFAITSSGLAGRTPRVIETDSARGMATFGDFAALAEGLLDLHDACGEARWRDAAALLADTAALRFGDSRGGYFDTDAQQGDLPARTRSGYDGEAPAPNAILASVLLRLAEATGRGSYAQTARATVVSFLGELQTAPMGLDGLASVASVLLGAGPTPSSTTSTAVLNEEQRGPVRAKLALATAQVRPGATLEATIDLTIAAGHSINSHLPPTRDLAALSVSVLSAELRAGAVLYPPAANVPRRYAKQAVAGYTGAARLRVPLRALAAITPGTHRLRLRVGFQACTESACAAPDSLVLEAAYEVPAR